MISWPDWVVRSSGSLPRRPTAVMHQHLFLLRSWVMAYWMPVEWPQPCSFRRPKLGIEGAWEPGLDVRAAVAPSVALLAVEPAHVVVEVLVRQLGR